MSQFVPQTNEVPVGSGAMTPCRCPYRCRKPTPATVFARWHPLRRDAEIRRCPECGREAIFPTGEKFDDQAD